ncbi:MAG: nucleotidyl transferase AbiEii/AbiGii toxin family protein [Candidatus Baltobacteraceae bacterium]
MNNPEPEVPHNIDPLGLEILGKLRDNPAAGEIIIGGGFALAHYHEFRETHDIDGWWVSAPTQQAKAAIRDAVETTASQNGYDFRERAWGETFSYEILRKDATSGKIFSFQMATRDVHIDPPRKSLWSPVLLETLRDNIASKMNALVDRGAPRDFIDIYELISVGICSIEECWSLWQLKNPETSVSQAKDKLLQKMTQIEARTSLEKMEPEPRAIAVKRREFFTTAFLKGGNGNGY